MSASNRTAAAVGAAEASTDANVDNLRREARAKLAAWEAVHKESIADFIHTKASHLRALLLSISGPGEENLDNLNEADRSNLLGLAHELSVELTDALDLSLFSGKAAA